MGSRLELQALLETLGAEEVYFQAPSTDMMKYPCILFKRDYIKSEYADNSTYLTGIRYVVTVIDKNPDSPIVAKVKALPRCAYDRNYVVDNLNHDVFTLYF